MFVSLLLQFSVVRLPPTPDHCGFVSKILKPSAGGRQTPSSLFLQRKYSGNMLGKAYPLSLFNLAKAPGSILICVILFLGYLHPLTMISSANIIIKVKLCIYLLIILPNVRICLSSAYPQCPVEPGIVSSSNVIYLQQNRSCERSLPCALLNNDFMRRPVVFAQESSTFFTAPN